MCIVYVCFIYIYILFLISKKYWGELYSRPSTLASTGAKVPLAPVESAPMRLIKNVVDKHTHVTKLFKANDEILQENYCLRAHAIMHEF